MQRKICQGLVWKHARTAARGRWIRCRKWARKKVHGLRYCQDCWVRHTTLDER